MRQSDMKDQPIDRQTRPAQGFAQACDEILIVQLPAFFAGEPVNDIDERSRAYDRLQFCHWILCSARAGYASSTRGLRYVCDLLQRLDEADGGVNQTFTLVEASRVRICRRGIQDQAPVVLAGAD